MMWRAMAISKEAERKKELAKARKTRERQRMRDAGFKRKELYVHDDDWPEVKELADSKMRVRLAPGDENQ